jgi:antitoxin component YwqK of YwqJK toxin-antitoxin module
MHRLFLIITVLLTAIAASGQYKRIDGLKTGEWDEGYESSAGFFKAIGNYRIISTTTYDKILEETDFNIKVKYKGSTPLVWFEKNINGRISVKDSIWNKYDREGRLRETNFWKDGLSQWAKHYDEKGNLTQHDYEDYDKDTSFTLVYIDGKLFKRAFYPQLNKLAETAVYYPNEPLSFSKAELLSEINFRNHPTDTKEIIFNATKDMTIKSISSIHRFVKVTTADDQPLSFPYKIKAGAAIPLKIIVSPTPTNYEQKDTLTLVTAESELPYRICLHIRASHICVGQELTLSKSKDKFLILPTMGKALAAYVTSEEGKKTTYTVSRIFKRIDLSAFSAGKYGVQIRACYNNGDFTLVVTE